MSGIPTPILFKSDGSLISSEGVGDVYGGGAKCFPLESRESKIKDGLPHLRKRKKPKKLNALRE